jgi:hypothetical protein
MELMELQRKQRRGAKTSSKVPKRRLRSFPEARRSCALENLANPIEKWLNACALASQIVEYSSESCPILLNSSQHFQCSTWFNVKFHINSRRL